MKIKAALITILFVLFCAIFPATTFAEQVFDVTVNASIDQDLYSQLSLDKSIVEIGQPTNVLIKRLDPSGNPKSGRTIQIYVQDNPSSITISQPPITDYFGNTVGSISSLNTATYTICSKDVTEIIPIYITDCESLFVVPVAVPVMTPEPQYTKGSKNTVSWNHSGSNTYEYQVQVSDNQDFSNILSTSPWIPDMSYEFKDLVNDKIHFYRVRAKNQYSGISSWSGYVYSIQDSSKPTVELLEIGDVGENKVEDWDNTFVIPMSFRVKDNVGISNTKFYCVLNDQSVVECEKNVSFNNDTLTVQLSLSNLEKSSKYQLYPKYSFCVEASDQVGNVKRFCDIEINIEHKETIVNPPKPDVEKTKDSIEKIVNDVVEVLDNTVGKLDSKDLQTATVTTTAATVTVGIGALVASLGYLPYILMELILSIFSFLGFRRKGNTSGYIYDSMTKEPISQAIVRILNSKGALIWTDVTDSNGYFTSPNIDNDEYTIKVIARNYTFPSKVIFGKEDFPLENVYHGDKFNVENGIIPTFSIPMDHEDISELKKKIQSILSSLKWLLKIIHILLFIFGLIFSIYFLYTNKLWWSYILIFLYIPSFILLTKNIFGEKEKWGIIKDTEGKAMENVIVGLKELEYGKLVSKRITNLQGKYRFIVDRGEYELVLLNPDLRIKEKLEKIIIDDIDGTNNVIALDLTVENIELIKKKEAEKIKLKKKREEEDALLIPLEEL